MTLPPLNNLCISAMLEALFDVDPEMLDLQGFMGAVDSVSAELQSQLRNPLRALQLKLMPGSQASCIAGFVRATSALAAQLACLFASENFITHASTMWKRNGVPQRRLCVIYCIMRSRPERLQLTGRAY